MQGFNVETEPAHVTYFFDRQTEGIQYKLQIEHKGKILDLKKGGSEILSHNPCWVLHNGSILHFNDGTDGNKISPFLKQSELHIPDKLADKFLESFMLRASKKFNVQYSGFNVITEPGKRSAVISIEMDLANAPVLQLNFKYDRFQVTAAQDQELLVSLQREESGLHLLRYSRDRAFEHARSEVFIKAGLKQLKPSWFIPESQDSWT